MIPFTLLASDTVEAMVEGRESSRVSLKTLTKALPMVWGEQRARLGVPHTRKDVVNRA